MVLRLGRKTFENLIVDIGEQRHTELPGEEIPVTPIIDLPELPLPAFRIRVNAIESHLADKICAMYEPHNGKPSTRFRDLPDIVRILETVPFSAETLATNLQHESRRRGIDLPPSFESPGRNWDEGYEKTAATFSGISSTALSLTDALGFADRVLRDVLEGQRSVGRWNPAIAQWDEQTTQP